MAARGSEVKQEAMQVVLQSIGVAFPLLAPPTDENRPPCGFQGVCFPRSGKNSSSLFGVLVEGIVGFSSALSRTCVPTLPTGTTKEPLL